MYKAMSMVTCGVRAVSLLSCDSSKACQFGRGDIWRERVIECYTLVPWQLGVPLFRLND